MEKNSFLIYNDIICSLYTCQKKEDLKTPLSRSSWNADSLQLLQSSVFCLLPRKEKEPSESLRAL